MRRNVAVHGRDEQSNVAITRFDGGGVDVYFQAGVEMKPDFVNMFAVAEEFIFD